MLGSDRVTLTGNLPKDHKSWNVIITCNFTLDMYTWYEFIFTSSIAMWYNFENKLKLFKQFLFHTPRVKMRSTFFELMSMYYMLLTNFLVSTNFEQLNAL